MKRYDKNDAISMLTEKARELSLAGEDKLPRRSDFDAESVVAIKSHLGPWPRALEAAGLKPPRPYDRLEKNRRRRAESRRRRRGCADNVRSADSEYKEETEK